MGDISRATSGISVDMVSAQGAFRFVGIEAGEDLICGDIVYVSNLGRLMKSVDTQVTISGVPNFLGMVNHVVASGANATVFGQGARFNYGSRMTPGALLYVSDTAGNLATSAVAGADKGVAICIDDNDIMIIGLPR